MTARASGASMTPSIVWPRRSAARYTKTGISGSGVFLRDSQHFLDGGDALAGPRPAVRAQRRHAALDSEATDLAARRSPENEAADVLGDYEQLIDGSTATVAGAATLVAPATAIERDAGRSLHAERLDVGRRGYLGGPAGGADPADEPLSEHAFQHRRDQVGLGAHILKSRNGAGRVVGVQRGEDHVAGEGGLDGDFDRLQVADLADEDHVGVLPDDVSESGGKGQPDLRLHWNLVHAFQLVLDGVFDGDDLAVGRVDLLERGVERGRLAGAGGTGYQQDAVGPLDERLEVLERVGPEAELLQRQEDTGAIEESHDDRFAVHGRNRGDSDVDAPAMQRDPDTAVLRQPPLADVHLGHQLDPRGDRVTQTARRRLLIEQDAVDPIADAQRVLERLDVDVGRLGGDGVLDEQVDQPDDGRLERHVTQVVDVFLALGPALFLEAFHDPL